MTDLIGKRLGEFEIRSVLGRGGMGVVYEAVQTSLNRRVALKVLGAGLGLTPQAVDRFKREAEAAARLHHTNIVPVYATGEQGGTHFYAMELIDGPGLDVVIRQLRERQAAPARSVPADLAATVTLPSTRSSAAPADRQALGERLEEVPVANGLVGGRDDGSRPRRPRGTGAGGASPGSRRARGRYGMPSRPRATSG